MIEPKETIRNKTRYLAKRYGLEVNGTPMQIKGMLRRDMYKLFAELGYTTGAEIGVFRGRNALAMFEEIPDLKLWLVDPYGCHPASTYDGPGDFHEGKKNKFREQARKRFEDSQKYNVIGYIYDYSENAVNRIPDNSLDFVYIDGDHSYTMAMLDIFLWSRKVKRDGVIAGHDYMYGRTREDEKAKVTQAVNGYVKAHKLPLFCTDYGGHNASRTGDNCPSFFFFKEHTKLSNREREKKTVGLVQYTDNSGDPDFMASCRRNLLKCAEQNNITETISVSHQPVDGFSNNIVVDLKREVLSIFKQILTGLESAKSDVIYLCEHDMIYHPSHFEFIPPEKDVFYYDCNRYSVDDVNGHAIFYYTDVPSMMCAYRDHLIQHYKRVVKWVEKEGWSGKYGYSPPKGLPKSEKKGTRQTYMAKFPSMDVRRKESWTRKRMSKDQFRNKNSNRGWREVSQMPGWPQTEGRFQEFWRSL